MKNYNKQKELRELICKKTRKDLKYYDVWIDYPEQSNFNEASH